MGDKKSYRKSLGLFELVSLGLGGTIGSGIFVVPGIAAGIAGPSSLIAWFFVSISASCVIYSLAKSSFRYPSTGTFYSIFSKAFGTKTSTTVVMLYLVSSIFGIATIAAGIGQYLSFFGFHDISQTLFLEILVIIAFCLINMRGIRLSGMTENAFTIAKVSPLIVLAILLLPYMKGINFSPFYPSASTDFLKTLVIVYWPFTGFELTAIPFEETKGGQNTVFRSLKIVMIIVVFLYVLLNVSLIGSLGSKVLAGSSAPLATASGLILKESQGIIAIIGIIAMLSALNAYMIGSSRVIQNISHLFNLQSLKELGTRGTPTAAIVLSAFIASLLLLFFSNRFQDLASISVIATLIPYIFVCLSTHKIFDNNRIKFIASVGAVSTSVIIVTYFLFAI